MSQVRKSVKIAVFGHYGNCNLGDEAITEAAIRNIKARVPHADIVCMSINPADSSARHHVDAFPIRYRSDFFTTPRSNSNTAPSTAPASPPPTPPEPRKSLKKTLLNIPVLGLALRALRRLLDMGQLIAQEARFLAAGKAYLQSVDLLMITGSNQFLDNFGGAWGFPYTLLKWTLLAKLTHTKVAYLSIGAGPLSLPLSYRMLNIALKKADFVSYRDEGSKALMESRINIDAPIYPDIAHSLGYCHKEKRSSDATLNIAVNPMPVYDRRYWYVADDTKFNQYLDKVTELCSAILQDGHTLTLFSTQRKDEDVIDDILQKLKNLSDALQDRIKIEKPAQVSELMNCLQAADIVVATRFHATVLPMQIGTPTIGICYYRKAAELLDEFGLQDFHVDIDDFDAETLIAQYRALIPRRAEISQQIQNRFPEYQRQLDTQYETVLGLIPATDDITDLQHSER